MQYPNCNDTGILVLNINPDSHYFLAVLCKRKTDFEIRSKSNLPIKQTRENYRITQYYIHSFDSLGNGVSHIFLPQMSIQNQSNCHVDKDSQHVRVYMCIHPGLSSNYCTRWENSTACIEHRRLDSENIMLNNCKPISLLLSPSHFSNKYQPTIYAYYRPMINHVKNVTQKGWGVVVYAAGVVEEMLYEELEE